ncbi:MAG: hypothetical protein HQ559_10880 [Lentisphaerae bacterium]|nr:hypothetical protein [Lentisphaerota bacterium]
MRHDRTRFRPLTVCLLLVLAAGGCDEFAYVGTRGRPLKAGIAYGPYRQHESPTGLQPTNDELAEDLDLLTQLMAPPRRLRIYSSTGGDRAAAIAATTRGFEVTVGASLDRDRATNEEEIAALISLCNDLPIARAVVGNEVLLRDELTADELIGLVTRVRAAIPASTSVTTAEPAYIWLQSRAEGLIAVVDEVMANVHPYWVGTPVRDAWDQVVAEVRSVQTHLPVAGLAKVVVLGETGWPTAGETRGAAVPSQANQRRFIRQLLSAMPHNFESFVFSAFDEPWKGTSMWDPTEQRQSEGAVGAHWGLLTWQRALKEELVGTLSEPRRAPVANAHYRVFTRGSLAPWLDLGLNTSGGRTDWARIEADGSLRLAYPSGQGWGACFITVGPPRTEIPRPNYGDFSTYGAMTVEMRGMNGGEAVDMSLKDRHAPDNGSESKVRISNIEQTWRTAVIPLSEFAPTNLGELYVLTSINFGGATPTTIYIREVRFIPAHQSPPASELSFSGKSPRP